MYSSNPLILAVLSILKNNKEALGLYELMQQLESQGYTLVNDAEHLTYELIMFRKNFVVMNALYEIQRDVLESGYYLYISALEINLCVASSSDAKSLIGDDKDIEADQKMSSYYLDWSNYNSTDQAAVEALLNNFWSRFNEYNKYKKSDEQRLDALTILELESDASWEDIQKSYRKKIAVNHPDKGGDSKKFIEIREAFQILKYFSH